MFLSQLIINIIISFSLLLMIGCSFSIIYFPTKLFNIAHGVIITIGPYIVYVFVHKLSFPLPISMALSIATSIILGILCESLIYRQMRKRNTPALSYLIASIGLYVVLQNCVSLFFGDDTKIINTAEITIGNQILGAYITTIQIITITASITLFILLNLFLQFTTTGKSIRAVANNPDLCNIYGISSNKVILIAFGIGSALAATAGIFSAMDTNMTPTFGFNLLLYGVVAMIIGGVGSTRGLLAGSFLVATAQHLAAYYIDTKWMDAITYIILILFLIWKPLGFSGNRLKKVEI
ncbi:MAG TPA: branched-chain amino acid ABC transporter permease [Saprospiraceae bacterium]|nr:branched-chain amino acid ABC transporter permease [Saprospiraceae bacterium]